MPSPFDVTVASNTVTLDNKREGIATFTVRNSTRRKIRATAKVSALPSDGEKFLTILPPESGGTDTATVRDFPIDSTQQYAVKIAVPLDAPPSSYTMKLKLADEVNPDENFTESQEVIFTVREIPKPEPRPFPRWIIPVVAVALLVIVGIVLFGIDAANRASASATATAEFLGTVRAADETATAVALFDIAQQTAVAETQAVILQTQAAETAVAQTAAAQTLAAGTQQALNVFVGTWRPINSGVIEQLGISSTGNNQMSVSYTSSCPPNQNVCFSISQTFTFTDVPFTPTQLAAGGSAVQLLIFPSNNNQLQVSVSSSGVPSQQTFTRRRFIDDIILDSVLELPSVRFSNAQIGQLQIVLTPGS